jgi:iron complex outermembrane receptor protein
MNTNGARAPAAVFWAIAVLLLAARGAAWGASPTEVREYNIQPQQLDSALLEFSRQGDRQVIGATDAVKGRRTAGVVGRFTVVDALKRLLAGTGLSYELVGAQSVRIVAESGGSGGSLAVPKPTPPSAAKVQPGSEEGLEEVIVTAERRAEPLQDVPISVTAFSQEQMDVEGLRSIDDITRLTPGVNFQRTGGSSNNYNGEESEIAIRGIQSSAGPQTTGIYLDDTPIQGRHLQFSTVNAYPALFDLQSVEVLRGPQGTLFGAGSEGGTVRFITPEPSLQNYSGYLRSEVADTDGGAPSYELGAAADGPISDGTLGFRVSASYRRDGGWVDRVDDQTQAVVESNSNWQETYVLRGALAIAPTSTLTITPSVYFQELYVNDTGDFWSLFSNIDEGVFRNSNRLNNKSSDPFILPAIKVDWNLGSMRLISNTAYLSRDQHARTDYTSSDNVVYTGNVFAPPGYVAPAYFTDTQNNFVQEVRLQSAEQGSKLNWVAGFFYGRQSENTTEIIYDPLLRAHVIEQTGMDLVGPELPGGYIYIQSPFKAIDAQYALFGQADMEVLRGLRLTAGLRVARVDFQGEAYEASAPANVPPITSSASSSQNPVTPRVGVSYQPDRDNLFYASVAKGYRIGGINVALPPLCASSLAALGYPDGTPPQYESDNVWSYELGEKSSLWDRRILIDASVYWINWQQIQQNVYLPSCGYEFTANLGKAVSKGGDLDARARVTEALTVGLTLGYSDAAYTETIPGSSGNVITAGDHLPAAPWTIVASAEYVFTQLGQRTPYFRVDYQESTAQKSVTQVQDPQYVLYDPTIPLLPTTKALAARSGVRFGGFDISVFGNNLLNTHPLLYASHDLVTSPLYFQYTWRPRTVGLTATYRY